MIRLREFNEDDIPSLVKILNTADVVKFLSSKIPFPYTKADAQWWVETGSKAGIVRAIEVDQQLVGCIGAEPGLFEYKRSAEVGYWIDQAYWRKGIASQALTEFVPHVFHSTDIVRLFASVFSSNDASKHVLRKCGFELEAVLKKAFYKDGNYYDNHLFSIIKSE